MGKKKSTKVTKKIRINGLRGKLSGKAAELGHGYAPETLLTKLFGEKGAS